MRYLDIDQRKRHTAQSHLTPSPIKVTPQKHLYDQRPQVSPRNIKKFDIDLSSQPSSISPNEHHSLLQTPSSGRRLNKSFPSEPTRVNLSSLSSQTIRPARLFNSNVSSYQEHTRRLYILWIIIFVMIAFVVSWLHVLHEANKSTNKSRGLRSNKPQRWTETIEIQSVKIIRHYPYERHHTSFDQTITQQRTMKYYPRITHIDENKMNYLKRIPPKRKIHTYPAEYSDNTQLYGTLDSDDPALSKMERRTSLENGGCIPMKEWQSAYLPVCNTLHELELAPTMDEKREQNLNLFGMKGYFRNAWRLDRIGIVRNNSTLNETVVLKTLRYVHNFEDAHFENNRIDAIAMERLTSSPHVINIYAFCGHSVITEYADGPRLGSLVDKVKNQPWKRLEIARDIASGLADIHGIDGDGNATFIHFDVNPANVVVIGDALKFNDFNIGIVMRWNQTSNTRCNVRTSYPNPQWRSPEEALGQDTLTEKIDVYSLGNIFFRLICGHEPWNKLELGGKPNSHEISDKVSRGILPFIPEEVRISKSQEVQVILEAMRRCYTLDPNVRPSAHDIATYLDQEYTKLYYGSRLLDR